MVCAAFSAWVVPMLALAPFAVPNQDQKPAPLSYLRHSSPKAYDIHLDVTLQSSAMREAGAEPALISNSNAKYLYWTFGQQLVHHRLGSSENSHAAMHSAASAESRERMLRCALWSPLTFACAPVIASLCLQCVRLSNARW